MTTNQFFLQATDLFYKNQYEKGLQKINKCLQIHPNNSTLLANRALFYSQIGHLEKAMEQLQYCIKLDYQNYIPYFNLFSLKVRKNQLQQALKDLCCSLSCLYLTRARFRKRQQDTKESIKYAKNNVQAHVLRGLMMLEAKKLKECINELDWAYQLDPNSQTLGKIRSIVQKKFGLKSSGNPENTISKERLQRLQSSYESMESDLMIEIKMKMTEFNSVYNDLNQQNGIVTHRVPRTLLPEQIQKMLQNSEFTQQIRELYELKYNASSTSEPVIYQMKQQYRIKNQIQFEERLKQDDQEVVNSEEQQVFSNRDEMNDDSLMDHVDEDDQQEIQHDGQKKEFAEEEQLQKQSQSQQQSNHEFQQYLVVDEYPDLPHDRSHIESKLQPSFSAITQEKSNVYDYMQSQVSSKDNQQVISLYPILNDRKMYGRFKIDKFQITNSKAIADFFQQDQSKQSSEILSNKQMYCVCTYFKEKPGYKVTTCDRELFFNSESKNLQCQWKQTFKEVLLTHDPQSITIKIYSKNYNSYNDDLVGTGSKLVQINGEIVVPVLSVRTSENLGNLYVKLYLIDK